MVSAVKKLFKRDSTGVSEAAFLIGFFSLVSQLLALVRDRSLAHAIGPSHALDVYYASFKIPDLLFVIIGTLVSVTAVLPFLVEKNAGDQNGENVSKFASQLLVVITGLLVVLSIVGCIFMPLLVRIIAPGFDEATLAQLTHMSRIMLLSPTLLGISNLFGTFGQFYKRFFGFALAPVFYNLGIILGAVYLYPRFGLIGLSVGVISGAVMHLVVQAMPLFGTGLRFMMPEKIDWSEMKRLAFVSLPRAFTISLSSLVFVVLSAIATTLPEGSVSLFTLSFNLQSVPLSVIGVSYAVALFPLLSDSIARGLRSDALATFARAYRHVAFWILPITALFIVLRSHIVRIILGTGAFTWENTRLAAAALGIFAIGFFTQSAIALLVRVFYSDHNTRVPLRASLVGAGIIVLTAVVGISCYLSIPGFRGFFEAMLRVSNTGGAIMLILPTSYVIGSGVQAMILARFAKKLFSTTSFPGLHIAIGKSGLAALGLGLATYGSLHFFVKIFSAQTFGGILMQAFSSALVGAIAYVLILVVMKSQELAEMREAVKKKFAPARILPDEIEKV